jgi:hypothetical protein
VETETASMLDLAAHLMFQQMPGRDNGRITTRLVMLALLYAGSISGGSPVAVALHQAWHRLGPKAFEEARAKYFRSFSPATEPAPPPVIIAGDLADALRLAAGRARDGAVRLLDITNALIEQALADVQGRTFSRRVMDEAGISPAALRDAFLEELAKTGIADLGSIKSVLNPPARDVYASFDNDKSVDRGDALLERASRQREKARRDALAGAENDIAKHRAQLALAAATFRTATPLGRLTGFIEAKVADEAYAKSLGLVAMIRRDFEVLTNCMVAGKPLAKATDGSPKERHDIAEARRILVALGEPIPSEADQEEMQRRLKPFRRIILYIDDLDRCATEKVVEVLQAVHLLLAFELFIVVVAVDYRWIRAALERSYRGQLQSGNENGEAATAADYLEKIFQIPYWVRRLDHGTSRDFLLGLIDGTRKLSSPSADPEPHANATTVEEPMLSVARIDLPSEQPATPRLPLGRWFERGRAAASTIKSFFSGTVPEANPDVDVSWAANEPAREPSHESPESLPPAKVPSDNRPLPARIDLTNEEEILLLALAPYAGRTPRQLKRFFNVYRVIKAAANGEETSAHAVLSLLAIATREPGRFGQVVQALDRAADMAQLRQILETQGFASHEDGVASLAALDAVDGAVTLADLKAQASIVARFSFCEPNWSRALPGPCNLEDAAAHASRREVARAPSGLTVVH